MRAWYQQPKRVVYAARTCASYFSPTHVGRSAARPGLAGRVGNKARGGGGRAQADEGSGVHLTTPPTTSAPALGTRRIFSFRPLLGGYPTRTPAGLWDAPSRPQEDRPLGPRTRRSPRSIQQAPTFGALRHRRRDPAPTSPECGVQTGGESTACTCAATAPGAEAADGHTLASVQWAGRAGWRVGGQDGRAARRRISTGVGRTWRWGCLQGRSVAR